MKPLPHVYEVKLAGDADGHAKLSAAGIPELQSAPPVDFDGPGDAWSPEHLFLAAVETCFLFTLRSVARASKLEFISLELAGEGKVDRKDGATRFTEIVLRPRVRVPMGTDKDRTLRILEKSEKACLVSASLSTPVRLEPVVLVG
jgi:peroxiredoxin-like protein